MEEVMQYLELKNHYFDKFLSLTQKFMKQVTQDEWNEVGYFVDSRDRILSIIRFYDYKIAELFQGVALDQKELDVYQERVKKALDRRAAIVKEIVKLDLELISKIDEVKNETIKELKKTQELTKQIESFSSLPIVKQRHEPPKDH